MNSKLSRPEPRSGRHTGTSAHLKRSDLTHHIELEVSTPESPEVVGDSAKTQPFRFGTFTESGCFRYKNAEHIHTGMDYEMSRLALVQGNTHTHTYIHTHDMGLSEQVSLDNNMALGKRRAFISTLVDHPQQSTQTDLDGVWCLPFFVSSSFFRKNPVLRGSKRETGGRARKQVKHSGHQQGKSLEPGSQ